jgi:hypothetical protein
MVFPKKVNRVSGNLMSIGIDLTINRILNELNIPFGLTIQHVMAYSPYDIALSIIAVKLGIQSKLVLAIIVAFLL